MYKILYKDWLIGRGLLMGIFLLMPFLVSMALWVMLDDFGGIQIAPLSGIVSVLAIFFSFMLIMIDTSFQSENILISLPIERYKIVQARYISTFILVGFNLILAYLTIQMHYWLLGVQDPALPILLSFKGLLLFYSGLILMLAFIFPFMFKMGSGKGVIVALTIQVVLPLLKPIFGFLLGAFQGVFIFDVTDLIRILDVTIHWVREQSFLSIIILFSSAVILFTLFSLSLSIRFYSKRDI